MVDIADLVRKAQHGDPAAYGVVAEEVRPAALGYAYSLLGDYHLAEDTVQDALIGAYHDLNRLRDSAAFPGWFRRIVFMRCTRVLRDRSRRRLLMPFEAMPEEPVGSTNLDEMLDRRSLQDILDQIIRELPVGQRDVTRMFYLSDYSQKEIATLLKIPVTTVKKRLQYARTRLRTRMTGLYNPGELAVLLDRPQAPVQATAVKERSAQQMDIKVTPATQEEAYILQNLYPLYLHDLSEFDTSWNMQVPNEHGILEPGNSEIRSLTEHGAYFNSWLEKPDILFPFLIRVDNLPAGFIYVATHPHITMDTDYYLHEMFLLHRYRGCGVGVQAALDVIGRFQGRWEVHAYPNDPRSQAFWRKTITASVGNDFESFEGPTIHGFDAATFRFINMDLKKDDPHMAAYRGDTDTLTRHLNDGLPVDARSAYGSEATLLHWAAVGGQSEAARLLLARGGSMEKGDSQGRPPLFWAMHGHWLGYPQGDRVQVAELLLEAGADAQLAAVSRVFTLIKERGMKDILAPLERYGVAVA